MVTAYLNRIETAVPPHDVHAKFVAFAPSLIADKSRGLLFRRMADRAQIAHRYSFLPPHADENRLDTYGFYDPPVFPDTAQRMIFYRKHALKLACSALDNLGLNEDTGITHFIVTTCTGFFAPGLDLEVIGRYGLNPATERTIIGFMGCHAALHALKTARHIVRSEPPAKILIVNLELCTIHLQQINSLEQLLSFLIFADGCAASIVSAEPRGAELQSFYSGILPRSYAEMTWQIGSHGFEMMLSGKVPRLIAANLPAFLQDMGVENDTDFWAIHPGGRSILDAVQNAAAIPDRQMSPSRSVLARYGNMSSPSVMFVLKEILKNNKQAGQGCAMAFGPGLSIEAMRFCLRGAGQ